MLAPRKRREIFSKHWVLWVWGLIIGNLGLIGVLAAGVIILGGVVGGYVLYHAVEQPKFCGLVCHNMRPAYETWKTSTHSGIVCAKCHSEPGLKGIVEGTIIGSMRETYLYVTRNFGKKPIVIEMKDRNCLRGGCHKTRLLKGQVFYRGVVFDHETHFKELSQSKTLGCTSCHSQMVVGSHIAVSESICFICHFKPNVADPTPSRCPSCHQVPIQEVAYKGMRFRHEDELRKGRVCEDCHADMAKGEGGVSKEKCTVCHGMDDVFGRHEDAHVMHVHHVTEHTVRCFACHEEIEHRIQRPMDLACEQCHDTEMNMVRGVDIHGTPISPSAMYTEAEMTCEDCHLESEGYRSNEAVCANCHEGEWHRTIESCQKYLLQKRFQVDELSVEVRNRLEASGTEDIIPRSLYDQAITALEIVKADKSSGVHNFDYANRLLDDAEKDLRFALSRLE